MAEKACHVVASATQVGLTQVLCGRNARFCKCLLGWFVASAKSSVTGAQLRRKRTACAATRLQWPHGRAAPSPPRPTIPHHWWLSWITRHSWALQTVSSKGQRDTMEDPGV